jgi:arylsulfatase B
LSKKPETEQTKVAVGNIPCSIRKDHKLIFFRSRPKIFTVVNSLALSRPGMQHLVILEPEPWGLPLNETLLPQHLKRNGYTTHAIGKWHLGFFRKEYTPTYRGFDSHFGYWQGLQDYYQHTVHATYTSEYGYDMRRNMTVDWSAKGKYSTTLFTEEAVRLIREHNVDDPMFMYLAHLAPHTGNSEDPLQAPDEEIAKFAHIADPERRIYAAMVSMLDKSVGSVITALRDKHMLENSIILFMSDNGAQTVGVHANTGSNYPFRGMKNSPWEGAVRGVSAVWSPLIKKPQRVSNALMHISDWLPTFYSAAGLNKTELPKMDGVDMWQSISEGVDSPRTELLYNIDDVYDYGALRQGNWKYLYGSVSKGKADAWYGSSGKKKEYFYDDKSVLSSQAASALAGVITYEQIKEKNEKGISDNFTRKLLDPEIIKSLRGSAKIDCPPIDFDNVHESKICNPVESPCLFDLKADPCERINLAAERPMIVMNMERALTRYKQTALPIRNVPRDPNADPAKWNNTWTNWQDCEDVIKRKIFHNTLSPLAIGLISAACVAFVVVIVVLVTLSVKTSALKKKAGKSFFDEPMDQCTAKMAPKAQIFEDRELQARDSIRNAFRTVE